MADKEEKVYLARLAEQAERYEGNFCFSYKYSSSAGLFITITFFTNCIRGDVHFHFATLIGICPIRFRTHPPPVLKESVAS